MKRLNYFIYLLVTLALSAIACSSVANIIATPTPLPTSTPVPTFTPVPTATPEGALFEASEFDRAGCFSFGSTDSIDRYEEGGAFHINIKQPRYIAWALCEDSNFSDFIYEADVTQVDGPDNNAYGIVFRYDTVAREFYAFNISGDGYYAFGVDGPDHDTADILLDWKQSPAIKLGKQTNHLKVVAVGSKIELYVNDQFLDEVQDSRLSSGEIGFFGYAPEEGASHYSFDNVKVTKP